jgi:hypothetical protein
VTENTSIEPINLHQFENEFFRKAIRRHVEEYASHFGGRLAAIYVSGSVHRNEAVPGISDLDLHPFITGTIAGADQEWWQRVRRELDLEFGKIYGLGQPRSITEEFIAGVQAASADRYNVATDTADGTLRWQPDPDERKAMLARGYGLLLRYDATLVWGRDLIEGLQIPSPDATWAQVWFLCPWELTRYAAGLTPENQAAGEHDLPEEPRLRLHELAKLAKLGGAALLMARGEFRSFRYADVFPALKRIFRQWAPFLDESTKSYFSATNPTPDEVTAFVSRLAAWMDWIGTQLYAARRAE